MNTAPLYRQLAGHYRQAIQQGALPIGDRLPSVRNLMRTHQVSLSTALQACRELEGEGWLEARPRSGYFVRTPRRHEMPPAREPAIPARLDPAAYVGVHSRISEFVSRTNACVGGVNLAVAVAAPEHYPEAALRQAVVRAARLHGDVLCTPVPTHGHIALRTALARRAYDQGMTPSADDVIVTHGCTEALNIALRTVTSPGDTVAVESPTYHGLLQVLETLGLRALEVPTSPQSGLSVEALELAFLTQPGIRAVVAVPNMQNPLGSIMPEADKQRLVALCERHGVPLIEDDTYGLLADDERPQRTLKSWDKTGNVIYCASLHKTLAPGMRLGWMMGGRWQNRAQMLKYANSRPNEALGQIAVAAFLDSRGYDRHLATLRRALRQQRERIAEAVARHFPQGTRLSVPAGGMLLWVELPDAIPSQQVFEQALAQGIRFCPGTLFSNAGRSDHFIRLSCGAPVTPDVEAAVRTIGKIVGDVGWAPISPAGGGARRG